MPIDVDLQVLYGDPWPQLRCCPSIEQADADSPNTGGIEVTALALEEDIYGKRYELTAEDAAFLAARGGGAVLLPSDVRGPSGRPQTSFVGTLRVTFLAWLASLARETRTSMILTYTHERGDWLYEHVRWTFGPREELALAAFDGKPDPIWEGFIERWNEPADGPEHGFYPLGPLLRDWKPKR